MFREQPLSFREQSAWISLLAYAGLYGYYFVVLFSAIAAGRASYTTNGLFLAIVLAEVARNTSQVVYFRRDA